MNVTSPKSINYANMQNEREAVIYEYSLRMSELINFKWLSYGQYWSNQNSVSYKMWSSRPWAKHFGGTKLEAIFYYDFYLLQCLSGLKCYDSNLKVVAFLFFIVFLCIDLWKI